MYKQTKRFRRPKTLALSSTKAGTPNNLIIISILSMAKNGIRVVTPEKGKRKRPRRSWKDDANEAMEARRLEGDMCYDKGLWKLETERRR